MKAKEYLGQILDLNDYINNTLEEIAHLKAIACNITAMNQGDRIQTSGSKDKIGDIVARICDLEESVNFNIDRRRKIKNISIRRMESMRNETYSTILYSRYILGKSLASISQDIGRKYDCVKVMHGRALKNFSQYMV